jgi:hypothetical protein
MVKGDDKASEAEPRERQTPRIVMSAEASVGLQPRERFEGAKPKSF